MDEYTCVDCGKEAWQVHHKEYAPEGETASLDMLRSVCPWCHGERHGKDRIGPVNKPSDIEPLSMNHPIVEEVLRFLPPDSPHYTGDIVEQIEGDEIRIEQALEWLSRRGAIQRSKQNGWPCCWWVDTRDEARRELQPHKGSSVTVQHTDITKINHCFNPTRVRL